MYGQPPAKPSFWKAWLVSLFFIVPTALVTEAMTHWPLWAFAAAGLVASLAIAFQTARYMPYDSKAQWIINYGRVTRRFRRPQKPLSK